MFLWDALGETHIHLGGADAAVPAVTALLDACTVPIAIHDHARAGILGTATLLRDGERHILLTAAHLFERASSSGNWLVPCRTTGQLLSLEGAQVRLVPGCDIAFIELARARTQPRVLRGRMAIPAGLALMRADAAQRKGRTAASRAANRTTPPATTYCLAGYPAAWSRFERGYLAAKRLTITTSSCSPGGGEPRCVYGHIAERSDGQVIQTPALEGMSGAAIWEIGRGAEPGRGAELGRGAGHSLLRLAGVQSAFVHSRYLRGAAATSCAPFLCG